MQGAITSVLSLTGIIGPLVGTSTFAYFVSGGAPFYFPGAPFAAGAVLIAGALAWFFLRPGEAVVESIPKELAEEKQILSKAA